MNTSSLSRELASGQHDNVPKLGDRLKKMETQDIESQVKFESKKLQVSTL